MGCLWERFKRPPTGADFERERPPSGPLAGAHIPSGDNIMRHRAAGRSPRRLTPTRRLTGVAVALSLLAASGVAVVIGTSFAGGSGNLIHNPGFETDLAGWDGLTSPQALAR